MMYPERLINEIKDLLIHQQKTVAVAESVTSGHLQAALSVAADARLFFQGGMTVYNAGQKSRHLHVDPIYCERVNCISQSISNTLAIEVQKHFASDFGIGITGYATPAPQCDDEGLHAYYALALHGKIIDHGKLTAQESSPFFVQVEYANEVIKRFHKYLTQFQ
jgi:nicotinamide-nucleotide amidase